MVSIIVIFGGAYGLYETLDGKAIFLANSMTLEAWDALCVFADVPELVFHPKLQTPGGRLGGRTHRCRI